MALGAADGLAAAAGRPPEDFLAATGPDDLEALTTTGDEDACLDFWGVGEIARAGSTFVVGQELGKMGCESGGGGRNVDADCDCRVREAP